MVYTRWALPFLCALLFAAPPAEAHHCRHGGGPQCKQLKRQYKPCVRLGSTYRVAHCHITRAARHYRQPVRAALRVARCESTYRWWIRGHHQGMFQFLHSTWRSTPFRRRSVYSPKWASMGAMWMWAHGRRGEWACR